MKNILAALTLLTCVTFVQGQDKPLTVVESVDLERYRGTWFEIARLPNTFQDMCISDVTATYSLDGDEIIVINRCRKETGEMAEAKGRARRSSSNEPNTKLKVRFAPAILSFLPFVWATTGLSTLPRTTATRSLENLTANIFGFSRARRRFPRQRSRAL